MQPIKLSTSYSTISASDLLQKVVCDYEIEAPQQCLFWSKGSNDIYEIRCADSKKYSARIYRHGVFPRESIDFELEALLHLHRQGFPAAYPIPRKSGGYVTEIAAPEGDRFVILTTFAHGEEPEYSKLEHCRLMGESEAQMHKASESFKTTHKRPELDLQTLLVDRVNDIRPHIQHLPDKLEFLEELVKEAREAVLAAPVSELDYGFVHADVHGSNNHLHEGKITHFDFEECAFGFRAFDLATFKWGTVPRKKPERWDAFIEGYQSVKTISKADLAIHDTFVLIRHIWLVAFHMRNAYDFGQEITHDDGYVDYHWKRLRKISGRMEESDVGGS